MNQALAITLTSFALAFQVCADESENHIALPPNYGQIQKTDFHDLSAGFSEPDMIYAPFAFWFWDEPLNPEKMAEMARTMASQKLNPGYAHPRRTAPGVAPSLPLPKEQWLSPLWFDAFGRALGEAEKQKAYLGYCDEYMWPSFQAAGRVLEQHPELKAASLSWETLDVEGGAEVTVPASFFAVAAQLAGPVPKENFQRPEPMLGQWIWQPGAPAGPHTCYFRKTLELPAANTVRHAAIKMTADDRHVLFVNGKRVGNSESWKDVRLYDVTSLLQPGRNVIAVEGGGGGGMDALTLGLRAELADGKLVTLQSDPSWRVAGAVTDGWSEPAFDDSAWKPVRVVSANPSAAPWNLKTKAALPHVPAVIRSDSLTMLSAAKSNAEEVESFVWRAPAGGKWRVYAFHKQERDHVNYLDGRLPGAFLPIAHDPYVEQMSGRMGKSIPGVFVDNEGGYGDGLAWSDTLERRYQQRWGRDIRQWMPLLVDDDMEGRFAKARWEWFEVVSDLYAETMGSTSKWLEQRGMYCIENLWEEALQKQARYVGDFFKLSRAYSMPGNDCLKSKALQVHDFKEVQSVAEFEGRRFMSEIMGAGGWQTFTPTLMKQAVNSVVAWGVGHIVPHGIFTRRNLDGDQWTPDWYTENPFFPYLHLWTDFARRASYLNSHGQLVPDVLLLNPMDTVWARTPYQIFEIRERDGFRTEKLYGERIEKINRIYSEAIDQLTDHRVEFLATDRHYLRQMELHGAELVRGNFSFRTVVMPAMDVLPLDVAQKITDFAKAGGHVYALAELPSGSTDNGLPDPAMAKLMEELQKQPSFHRCENGLASLVDSGAAGLTSQIQFVSGSFPMLQHHRRIDGRDFFWLVNNSEEARQCVLKVAGASGEASVWDCETGKVRPVASTKDGSGSRIQLVFQPLEAYWLVFDPKKPELAEPVMALPEGKVLLQLAPTGWNVRVDPAAQPNLEHPVVIPAALTAAEGVTRDLTPWGSWSDLPKNFSGLVDYTQTITLPDFKGDLVLDLGKTDYFAEVWVNGKPIGAKLWPPHRFPSAAFRPGKNEIRIRVGNLVNNNYGVASPSGLLGPVTLWSR